MLKNYSINNDLLTEQVSPLFKATLSGGLANVFAAFLAYTLLHNTEHQINTFWICSGIIFFSTVRIFVANDYLTKNRYELKQYLYTHLSLTFIIGIFWALCAFLLHQPGDESARNIVYLINFGLIAGSIATLSTYRPAYLAYMLPQSTAIITVFLIIDSLSGPYIALAIFLSTAFMMMASFTINRSHIKTIELTYNNKELINDLNNEIGIREKVQFELEDNKRKLEHTVEERTKDLLVINTNLEKVIEKKEQAEESLQYLAYHDELTGLPNRTLLVDRINHSIDIANRNKQQIGILFLDLDRFKSINDSLGHNVGDKLIKDVANRLLQTLRKEDTISRNGGDEFVVVIQRIANVSETIGIAQKLIENLRNIFEIDAHKIHIGASIGISIYPNDGDNALELLRNADTAMFSSKKAGGNRLQFYDESMSNRLRERLVIESELHTAMSRDEFYLVYQPQVNCHTGQTIGFEALLRWENKELGTVSPGQFVPLLEETGLIYEVGEWVIKNVIDFLKLGHVGDALISINLSALQCGDLKLVNFINSEIQRAGIDASKVEFEITESLLINDFKQTEMFLNKLHEIGCSIALDDFGTGYTSMSYLTRLPIDIIKVDQTFIMGIDKSQTLETIVKAIVNMSASLGIRNIFEGVETVAELDVVKRLDGDVVQGYLYSKPLQVDEIDAWLNTTHMMSHG
ncbi:MAG: EAL domain-containing protein [Gammaproteobacteria bacterium]|nr:EAL domain-containing protein [Gammaproteobacteria bacterium]